jgi:hypothetical protein
MVAVEIALQAPANPGPIRHELCDAIQRGPTHRRRPRRIDVLSLELAQRELIGRAAALTHEEGDGTDQSSDTCGRADPAPRANGIARESVEQVLHRPVSTGWIGGATASQRRGDPPGCGLTGQLERACERDAEAVLIGGRCDRGASDDLGSHEALRPCGGPARRRLG